MDVRMSEFGLMLQRLLKAFKLSFSLNEMSGCESEPSEKENGFGLAGTSWSSSPAFSD